MKTFLAAIIILLIFLGVWYWYPRSAPSQGSGTQSVVGVSVPTPGGITFTYATSTYGLATNASQLLAHSYIPPCNQGFDYCIYRIGTDYAGTNFESAGLRINARPDLTNEKLCLNTPPAGYDSSIGPTATTSTDTYSTSVFGNIGDAGAGHYASGSLYRLFVKSNSSCTEFETRIGETQFANYPAGSIQLFTDADRVAVMAELRNMIDSLMLAISQTTLIFPKVVSSTTPQH
jgi:hypothetical protein